MEVIDQAPNHWYLLKEEDSLYLDGNYNHSFIGYNFTIKLNDEERKQFGEEGSTFISQLSDEIQNSAPILKISKSRFKGRDIKGRKAKEVTEAIVRWREENEAKLS